MGNTCEFDCAKNNPSAHSKREKSENPNNDFLVSRKRLGKCLKFLWYPFVVSVEKRHDFSSRLSDSGVSRNGRSLVLLMSHNCILSRYLRSFSAESSLLQSSTTIISNILVCLIQNALNCRFYKPGSIICWYYNRNHLVHRSSSQIPTNTEECGKSGGS